MDTRPGNSPGTNSTKGIRRWLPCALIGGLGIIALAVVGGVIIYFYFYGSKTPQDTSAATPASGPSVTILDPTPGSQLTKGDSFVFFASANDGAGVIRLDLWVDDVLVLSQSSPDATGLPTLSLSYPMIAVKIGDYALIARAYNSRGEFGESAVHYVSVKETAVPASTQEYAQYVVQEGDTLENIAARLGVSVDDILAANPQISGGQVFPGQVIIIPMPKGQPPQVAVPGPNGVQPIAFPGGGQPGPGPQGPAPNPPNPPPPGNQPSLTIKGISVATSPAFYGQSCTTEPLTTNVTVTVDPPNAVKTATLKYAYYGKAGSSPVLSLPMVSIGGSDFGANINAGGEAAQYLAQDGGAAVVWVEVTDANAGTSISQSASLIINFCPIPAPPPNLGNLPGILPQFMPGAPPSLQPGQNVGQLNPNLFPAPNNVILNPANSNITAPQDVKASAKPGDCSINVTWSDAQNETGYRVDRYEFGKPNPKTIGDLSANATIYADNSLIKPGKYGYRILAIQDQGGIKMTVPSTIVWVELPSSDKCKPLPEFKRIHFQPVSYESGNASTHAFVQVTIGDLPTFRIPRGQQTSYPISLWRDPVLGYSAPAPEQLYKNPGASLYLEVQGNGTALNVPPVGQGQFAASHPMMDLTAPNAKDKIWMGQGSGFKLTYQLWLDDWSWDGQASNSTLPAPTNMKLSSTDPGKRILTWDYDDPSHRDIVDGFIIYRQYSCPGGDTKIQYPLVAGKNHRGVEMLSQNEPVGCACLYQISAFNGAGESALSAPPQDTCTTTQPTEGVEVTFISLKTDQSLISDNTAVAEINLFANEFERHSRGVVIENGKTYPLNTISFNGKTNNNSILVGIGGGNALTVNLNFSLPGVCQGNGLIISKQGNSWARSDGQNYVIASPNGKCQVEVSVKDHAAWQGVPDPVIGVPGGQPIAPNQLAPNPPAPKPPVPNQPPPKPPAPQGILGGQNRVSFVNQSQLIIVGLDIALATDPKNAVDVITDASLVLYPGSTLIVPNLGDANYLYTARYGKLTGPTTADTQQIGPLTQFAGTAQVVNIPAPNPQNQNDGDAFLRQKLTAGKAQNEWELYWYDWDLCKGLCSAVLRVDSGGRFEYWEPDANFAYELVSAGTYQLVSHSPDVEILTFKLVPDQDKAPYAIFSEVRFAYSNLTFGNLMLSMYVETARFGYRTVCFGCGF